MLTSGTLLGPYELVERLGAGGMGEVYRARDPRLGRDVAVKVIRTDDEASADRLKRFEDEARAVAALSHPNVLTVFDVGSHDGTPYVVFELLEGETLRSLVERGPLPLRRAVELGVQVCRGLEAAHERGLVHRDLKPENLLLTRQGQVKILDFGLAKLTRGEDAPIPGEASRTETAPGTILGTLGYLSPEQVRGQEADARSDLFALGAVLYEMVSGRRAFSGETPAETVSAILNEDPPGIVTPSGPASPALERVVRRCLEKVPEERFQSARDVAFALDAFSSSSRAGMEAAAAPTGRRRRRLSAAVALLATAVVGIIVATRLVRHSPDLPSPRVVPLTSLSGFEVHPTFSPDGEQVAFDWDGEKADNWDIYLTMVGSPEVRRLTTDPAPEVAPSWSPDGRQIAFACGVPESTAVHPNGFMTICLVSPLGGFVRKLSEFPVAPGNPPSWSPDGRWLAVERAPSPDEAGLEGLYLLPVQGGEPRRLDLSKEARGASSPRIAPDGRHLAFVSQHGVLTYSVGVVELSPDFSPKGPPRDVTPPTVYIRGGPTWARDARSLVYADTRMAFGLWRVGIAGERPPERIEIAGREAIMPAAARSRDRLAFVRVRRNTDVYRFETGRPSEPVLASSFAHDYNPDSSPDGRRIAFESDRSGEGSEIWLAESDGSSPAPLTRGPGLHQGSPRWSPDGRRVAFDSLGADGHWDVWTIGADGGSLRRVTSEPGDEHGPSWSRDGRFLYFTALAAATREGSPEVWRVPATGGPGERLTAHGGWHVQDSLDGKMLYFQPSLGVSPLLALPLTGGTVRQVVSCISSFAVGPAGLYYIGCTGGPPRLGPASPSRPSAQALSVLDPATGRDRLLGKLEWATDWWGPTVSPDGKTILLTRWVEEGGDLMMIEDFR